MFSRNINYQCNKIKFQDLTLFCVINFRERFRDSYDYPPPRDPYHYDRRDEHPPPRYDPAYGEAYRRPPPPGRPLRPAIDCEILSLFKEER